jgi:Na+/H+ antiporter NhaD/arsenite permease-like protein
VGVLSLVSAALSNLVSNVPAVLLFKPVIPAMAPADQPTAWLALAMSSTLAGNLTVLGSVANLIVVESARREGVTIGFAEYLRVGIPVTLLTLALGVGYLHCVRHVLGP